MPIPSGRFGCERSLIASGGVAVGLALVGCGGAIDTSAEGNQRPAGAGGAAESAGASSGNPPATKAPGAASPPLEPISGPQGVPCGGAEACERVVFVTSQAFSASFGGPAGADAKCTTVAKSSKASTRVQGREFIAWLSSESSSAKSRLARGTAAYVRPDAVRIAANFDALVSGSHDAPISLDEMGAQAPDDDLSYGMVWTATRTNGDFDNVTFMLPVGSCAEWSGVVGSNELATTGRFSARDQQWTFAGSGNCFSFTARLYCIER